MVPLSSIIKTLKNVHSHRYHDDVIKWKHFPRYWPFVRGIHRSPANSPHKGQWRGTLIFPLIFGWTNGWINNHEAGDLRRHEICCYNDHIALKFKKHLDSAAAKVLAGACQIAEQLEKSKAESRGFETPRDPVVKTPIRSVNKGWWPSVVPLVM